MKRKKCLHMASLERGRSVLKDLEKSLVWEVNALEGGNLLSGRGN